MLCCCCFKLLTKGSPRKGIQLSSPECVYTLFRARWDSDSFTHSSCLIQRVLLIMSWDRLEVWRTYHMQCHCNVQIAIIFIILLNLQVELLCEKQLGVTEIRLVHLQTTSPTLSQAPTDNIEQTPCVWTFVSNFKGVWVVDLFITIQTGCKDGTSLGKHWIIENFKNSACEIENYFDHSFIQLLPCPGDHKYQQEGVSTLTTRVLGAAVCFFKVVLYFAFHSPTERAFCWVENKGWWWVISSGPRIAQRGGRCPAPEPRNHRPWAEQKGLIPHPWGNGPESLKG